MQARIDAIRNHGGQPFMDYQLPRAVIALKQGADGVLVVGCRENDCYYRFGNRWLKARFSGERRPGPY